MKRLFAAIKIYPDENLLKYYYRLRKSLKNDSIKWVEPENMHLTLKFFGETPDDKISGISRVFKPIASSQESFKMQITDVGIFGSRYNPRVIWFGIEEYAHLKNLGNLLLEKLDEAGFPNDRQNFVPHFTVGRIKELVDKDHFQQNIDRYKKTFFQEVEVNEIILFESILKPEGPKYFQLEKYKLKKNRT